jgi:putative FmdB family regulatory protein
MRPGDDIDQRLTEPGQAGSKITCAEALRRQRPGTAGHLVRLILSGMPRYDYRCRACGATFEISRPMTESSAPVVCPEGHDDTVKLLSTVALTGRAGSSAPLQASGGGCCGGGACACGH